MEVENIHDSLMKLFGKIPKNINILEEQVDINIQMSYFEASMKFKKDKSKLESIDVLKEKLFDDKIDDEEKKNVLAALANFDDVEAYRAIEKFNQDDVNTLKDWSTLALQESRMAMESYLLNEDQIIISTGLGGKDNKLRYFLAFSTNNDKDFTELQQRLFTKELEFSFRNNEGEIENLEFNTQYCLLTVLLPLNISIKDVISATIDECNQIGNFLETRFIVTNVKILTIDEISDHWDDDVDLKRKV